MPWMTFYARLGQNHCIWKQIEMPNSCLPSPSLKVKLGVRKRDRLGLAGIREPVVQLRCHGSLYTSALPPHHLQGRGQRLATEVPLLLVRKLADGEVCLLLAGARSAEGYTQDLHLRDTGTRTLRHTAYLATSLLRHLGQGTLCSTALRPPP